MAVHRPVAIDVDRHRHGSTRGGVVDGALCRAVPIPVDVTSYTDCPCKVAVHIDAVTDGLLQVGVRQADTEGVVVRRRTYQPARVGQLIAYSVVYTHTLGHP